MGKFLAVFTIVAAIAAGAGIYYAQVYAYYDELPEGAVEAEMRLTVLATGRPEPILASDLEAIDSNSSPLRFRACFTTPMSAGLLTETFEIMDDAVPLTGPGWFDCYNAVEIGEALERGDALAFLSERDIRDGVDRVIAVFPDGRGFAWHQLNEKYRD